MRITLFLLVCSLYARPMENWHPIVKSKYPGYLYLRFRSQAHKEWDEVILENGRSVVISLNDQSKSILKYKYLPRKVHRRYLSAWYVLKKEDVERFQPLTDIIFESKEGLIRYCSLE